MPFRVQSAAVPGTRNARKPHQHWIVPGVPGVPALAPVCAYTNIVFHTRAHYLFSSRVHRRNTRNSRNNDAAMRFSSVPGTRNTNQTTRNTEMTKPLRLAMPTVAAFIDDLRGAFGPEMINSAIRAGMDGQPTFWARENGTEIGTRAPYSAERAVKLSDTHVGPFNATASHAASRKGK